MAIQTRTILIAESWSNLGDLLGCGHRRYVKLAGIDQGYLAHRGNPGRGVGHFCSCPKKVSAWLGVGLTVLLQVGQRIKYS